MVPEILPPELEIRLENAQWIKDTIGCSPAAVYKISNYDSRGEVYLKIQKPVPGYNLRHEAENLRWLKGKLPVPEVLYFREQKGRQFLVISEIRGLNAAHPAVLKDPEQTVRLLARGLRRIHSIYTGSCPIYNRLEKRLLEAEKRVRSNITYADAKYGVYGESRAERLLILLKKERPTEFDLVFTHGDYCMPNIIINNGEISGFIDWGQGGIADRYQDLALAYRSIMYNIGSKKWVELFFDEYGLENMDHKKIKYYMLLDELFIE